jgi:hypothetical protein
MRPRRNALLKFALATTATAGALVLAAGPAAACGGLIGENGSIALVRTTTLAAWHDGIEHYVTSFEFSGEGESVGSIIPLPAEPTDVVAGGDWTLQRLQLEVAPPARELSASADAASAGAAGGVEILLETEVDALDITVLSGGGDAVGQWAIENGFLLTPDTPEVLDFYAARSPVFLAAKFNAARAAEQGLSSGQGTPVHITMPTPRPWVPLRILGLGLDADRTVQADVFLLTDDEPELLAGGDGLTVERSVAAGSLLLNDLRSDVGMEWVPERFWLTHLTLDEAAGDLDYDLSASGGGSSKSPSAVDAGLQFASVDRTDEAVVLPTGGDDGWSTTQQLAVAAVALGAAAFGAGSIVATRRQDRL